MSKHCNKKEAEKQRTKPGGGRRSRWFDKNKVQIGEYAAALSMLSTGGTAPKFRSIQKAIGEIRQSPLVAGNPAVLVTARHARGSWRSWPARQFEKTGDAA